MLAAKSLCHGSACLAHGAAVIRNGSNMRRIYPAREPTAYLTKAVCAVAGFLFVWQTWYLGITSFCVYSCSYGIQYFTPLIVDALQSHQFNGIVAQSKPRQGSAYAHHTAVIALISEILFVPCAITTVANALLSMWARNRRFFASVPMTLAAIMFLVSGTSICVLVVDSSMQAGMGHRDSLVWSMLSLLA